MTVTGVDMNRDGIPDVLQQPQISFAALVQQAAPAVTYSTHSEHAAPAHVVNNVSHLKPCEELVTPSPQPQFHSDDVSAVGRKVTMPKCRKAHDVPVRDVVRRPSGRTRQVSLDSFAEIIGVPDVEDRYSAWCQCRRDPCRSSSSDWIRDSSIGRHLCYISSRVRMRDALFCDRWRRTCVSRDFPRPVNCCLLPTPWNPSPLVPVLTPPVWRTRNLPAQMWRPHVWRVCSSVLTTMASIWMWVLHADQKTTRQRLMSWNKCWKSNVPSTVRVRTPKKVLWEPDPPHFEQEELDQEESDYLQYEFGADGEYVELLPRPCCLKTAFFPVVLSRWLVWSECLRYLPPTSTWTTVSSIGRVINRYSCESGMLRTRITHRSTIRCQTIRQFFSWSIFRAHIQEKWGIRVSTVSSVKIVNLETITDMQSRCRTWPLNGSCRIRVKKTSQETQRILQQFLEPDRKPKVIYADNSFELGNACEDLSLNHSTSTPHRSETNRIAERAVRRVKEGTSAVLLQSGLSESWWADSMDCYTFLRNVINLFSDGNTPYERRFGQPFKGPIIPFVSLVEYHP